ncbi:hypothetical protein PAPHI01_0660 [Pancytospora philotis]|nr:hypothetical protein PAPHI01_0660 [Pancytospora philotis]
MGRRSSAVLIAAGAAGAAYALGRLLKEKRDHNLAHAMVCLRERDYQEAAGHLAQIAFKSKRVLLLLSDCHEQIGNLADAIAYVDLCLKRLRESQTLLGRFRGLFQSLVGGADADEEPAGQAGSAAVPITMEGLIARRLRLHKACDMHRAAFKDAFLLGLLTNDGKYKSATSESLKACSLERARDYRIVGWASRINFDDFFETLFFLADVQDPAAVFIASSEYEKCYELVKDGDTELHRFLRGCFCYVNGSFHQALAIFRTQAQSHLYSRLMLLFVKCTVRLDLIAAPEHADAASYTRVRKNGAPKRADASGLALSEQSARLDEQERKALAEFSESSDPTVLFYASKIYEGLKMPERSLALLDKCIAARRTAPAVGYKIVLLLRTGALGNVEQLISDAVETFTDSLNLYCIAIEFYLHCSKIQRASELLAAIEHVYRGDPRICVFKYLISKALGRADISFLRAGVEADRRYFRVYMYLGNHLMGESEAKPLYLKALACSKSFEEAYTVFQVLTVVETEEELTREYPELLSAQANSGR